MADRLFGLETEYGIVEAAGQQDGAPRDAPAFDLLKRARATAPGIDDLTRSGLFLQNGAAFYIDSGHHPEMTTPEVANPWDVVRYVLAGERILEQLVAPNGNEPVKPGPLLLKTNIDYVSCTSWGCHESILHSIDPAGLPGQIVPHLVSRVIYTGAGGFNPHSPGAEFVLSPRSMLLDYAVSRESTRGRGIFHTKNEPLSGSGHNRLHIICGESLCSEIAMWLRTATTVLVVAMVEGGVEPAAGIILDDPVGALRAIAVDPTCRVGVPARGRGPITALEIQRHFLSLAEAHVGASFMPPWAETACGQWRTMLDRLERAPDSVSTTLDWAIKRGVFERVMARHGFDRTQVSAWNAVLADIWKRLREDNLPEAVPRVEAVLNPSARLLEHIRAASPLRTRERAFVGRDRRIHQPAAGAVRVRRAIRPTRWRRDLRVTRPLRRVDAPHAWRGQHRARDREPACERAGETPRRGHQARPAAPRHLWSDLAISRQYGRAGGSGLVESVRDRRALEPGREAWDRCSPTLPFQAPSDGDEFRTALEALRCRDAALECFLRREYQNAERLLLPLLDVGFEVAGTHCHLARLYLQMGRDADARRHSTAAWDHRATACRYVVGRTLWLLTLFAFIDGTDASPWFGRMKTLGPDTEAIMSWAMEPVLEGLRGRLAPEAHAMLSALFEALNSTAGVERLRAEAWWAAIEPVPVD